MLLLYSMSEFDCAIGRNAIFDANKSARNFTNDKGEEPVICESECFTLSNYDLKSLASDTKIGHTDYKTNLKEIL